MKFNSERFGEIEVNDEDILSFPKGILGFEEYKQYTLINVDEQDQTFFFLQSIEEADLCFLMLNTFTYFPDYQYELDALTIEQLQINDPGDVFILTIITATNSLKEATTNLQAPVILNTKNNTAKQVVLEKGGFLIKQPLFNSDEKPKPTLVKG